MTLDGFFRGIGDFLVWTYSALEQDAIGDKFNFAVIALGFFGLFFWLNTQHKLNKKARQNPDQLK